MTKARKRARKRGARMAGPSLGIAKVRKAKKDQRMGRAKNLPLVTFMRVLEKKGPHDIRILYSIF